MKYKFSLAFTLLLLPTVQVSIFAQQMEKSCTVKMQSLVGTYNGECKKGLANGRGEAKGLQHYIGQFKDGLPNGKGMFKFSDSLYYDGNFQDGIMEGKGEMHYVQKNLPDSLVKGFWSANEYRGKKYTTYTFNGQNLFDQVDIIPSTTGGNTLTFEIATTTGSPNGAVSSSPSLPGIVITLDDLVSTDRGFIRKVTEYANGNKTYVTYDIPKFPIKLIGTLSTGRVFQLELYKSATWTIRFFKNV